MMVISHGKRNTIQKVAFNSSEYCLGFEYLLKNHPDNTHLLSCYEGISFRNLARCIMFDRTGNVLSLDEYLEIPQRYIIISPVGKITGVMVKASMPEFYREIEYEDYVVIGTENVSNYGEFLENLSFDSKAEIVTFNAEQEQIVRSRFRIRTTHYWSVFSYRDRKTLAKSFKVRLMSIDDIKMARQLSENLPVESSLFRSLKFQLGGLSYKNYALSFDDGATVFVGICPYSSGIFQLIYLVGPLTNSALLLSAIETIGKIINTEGQGLIWRLRKSEALQKKAMIKQVGFVELAKEKHLHLK